MKHFIIKSVLALGTSGMLLMAQTPASREPQSSQTQSTPATDTQMTTKVRDAIMNDQNIGTAGHNIRVSSHNGMVTLRGKVMNEQERDAIVAKAKQVAGDANVKDDITVAKQK